MRVVAAGLSLRSRADRAYQGGGPEDVFALERIAKGEAVNIARRPVNAIGREQIVERRVGETFDDRTGGEISLSDEHDPVLIPILERTEEPRAVSPDRPAEGERVLLAVEGRRLAQAAVKRGGQSLQAAVTKIDGGGAVQLIRPGLGDDVDDGRA